MAKDQAKDSNVRAAMAAFDTGTNTTAHDRVLNAIVNTGNPNRGDNAKVRTMFEKKR